MKEHLDENESSRRCDFLFMATIFSSLGFLFVLTVHNVIYNWVFLPRYFEQHGVQWIVSIPLLRAYWEWRVGRVLIVLCGVSLLVPICLFAMLQRRVNAHHEKRAEVARSTRERRTCPGKGNGNGMLSGGKGEE